MTYTLIIDGAPLSPTSLLQADAIWQAALVTGRRVSLIAKRER
jgi:hypothetical protein